MRHRKSGSKLNRTASHRKAMLRNMVTSLFEHEKIVTTHAKARELRPLAEKMITLAKRGDLHARRQALAVLTKKSITAKLFSEIKDRYMEINGGYTALIKVGPRVGDAAPLTVIELVDPEEREQLRSKKTKKVKTKKAAPKKEETVTQAEPEETVEPAEMEARTEAEVNEDAEAEVQAEEAVETDQAEDEESDADDEEETADDAKSDEEESEKKE